MAERTDPAAAGAATPANKKVTPAFFSRDTGATLPYLDRSAPYILAHHPKRYMVMDGRLVPSPSQIALVDGVNRVRVAADGRIYFSDTQAKLQDRGFKLIPFEKGPGGESYLQEIDTRPDGREVVTKATISVWQTAFAGSDRAESDEAGYATWLEELVAEGFLPKCPVHVANAMLQTARSQLQEAEQQRAQGKLSDATRIDALTVDVAVLEKAAGKPQAAKATRGAPRLEAEGKAPGRGNA
jgi:hypothetical protein